VSGQQSVVDVIKSRSLRVVNGQQIVDETLLDAADVVAELVSQADKADKLLHNLIEAYVPAHTRPLFHAEKRALRVCLAAMGGQP
jgi:hypothetical protein